MLQVGREITGIKKSISTWAKGLGAEKTVRAQFGGDGGSGFMFGCANSIVLSKVKDTLGLDQCKAAFTAAAPIAKSVIEYFGSLDIPLYEVFGQSECTGELLNLRYRVGHCSIP